MKDIQQDVKFALDSIELIDKAFDQRPRTLFKQDVNTVVVFSEVENEPGQYCDGLEEVSVIFYNFDIYMKTANTYLVREEINAKMTELGFTRETSGAEERTNKYYRRLLSYKILI